MHSKEHLFIVICFQFATQGEELRQVKSTSVSLQQQLDSMETDKENAIEQQVNVGVALNIVCTFMFL